MMTAFCRRQDKVLTEPLGDSGPVPDGMVWVDVLEPSPDEKQRIEAVTGIAVPTPEEMREIEPSSRLYREGEALFMTASVLHKTDTADPQTRAVTFVLVHGVMISIRYCTPRSFETFQARIHQQPGLIGSAETGLVGLLDAIIDRIADAMEMVDSNVNVLSKVILSSGNHAGISPKHHREELNLIGQNQVRCSKADESLVSLSRALTFLDANLRFNSQKEIRFRIKSLQRDAASLAGYAERLSERLEFLLDATLGAINIEQTNIIKIFSVVAVAFLPPTLIASIYGMNFRLMPELDWPWGYPLAVLLMVMSAILPFWFFKHRGWL
jgi:magnesium transporter